MSQVHASIVQVNNITGNGVSMLVEDCGSVGDTEELSSNTKSGISVATTSMDSDYDKIQLTANEARMLVWRISNMGTDNIYVAFGTTPDSSATSATAATTAKKGVPAGFIAYFGVKAVGDFVEYVNA